MTSCIENYWLHSQAQRSLQFLIINQILLQESGGKIEKKRSLKDREYLPTC